jgi:hypothetical protein
MSIIAYEDIKNACAEAIKSMWARDKEVEETKEETPSTTNDSNSTPDVTTATAKDQKKKKSKSKTRARDRPESG